MHGINSSVANRLARGLVLSLLAAAFAVLPGLTSTAAADGVSVQLTEDETRTEIVSVTRWQLINPRPYKTDCGSSTIYQSTPEPDASPPYNYLGRNGSNENCNIFNGYNGQDWCGYFARWAWDKGGAYDVAQKPTHYASSQAWMTETGSRFHPYGSILPKPGDVVVWTNNGDPGHGHVAVVTFVNTSNRTITYIAGNEATHGNSDSIVQHSDYWSNMDISMEGKTFRGFASRF